MRFFSAFLALAASSMTLVAAQNSHPRAHARRCEDGDCTYVGIPDSSNNYSQPSTGGLGDLGGFGGNSNNLNPTSGAGDIIAVCAQLEAQVGSAIAPLLGIGAAINAQVIADVQVKVLAAIQVAVDAVGHIQASGQNIALSITQIITIATHIAVVIQVFVVACAKVSAALSAEVAVLIKAVDAHLVAFIQLCLHIAGPLGVTLCANVIAVLKANAVFDVVSHIGLQLCVQVLGLVKT